MLRRPCPNDSMLIPQVAQVCDGPEMVRFFWCWSCMELFAFIGEPGRLAAGFVKDGQGGWRTFRASGAVMDVQHVPPLLETSCGEVGGCAGPIRSDDHNGM